MKVEYVDHMGNDLSVVNAARVSMDKRSKVFTSRKDKPKGSDEGLIYYLARHNHWTPFAHTAITLRMTAPIPIRTQCFKHKIGFVENEVSRRYVSSRPKLFTPEEFREKPEGSIKQGSGETHPMSGIWLAVYLARANDMIDLYDRMIADGVCPEQARLVLPQGVEVEWVWTGNLVSYARFFISRTDPHAQKEIRDLAHMVAEVIEPLFPVSWKALVGNLSDENKVSH